MIIACVYSERFSSLHPAANWWSTETGANVAILINFNVVQWSVFIEVWKRVAIDSEVPELDVDLESPQLAK